MAPYTFSLQQFELSLLLSVLKLVLLVFPWMIA